MNNASVSSKSLLFVVFALFGISFARAADQVVTWKYEAQEISLYSDESLTIQWTGTHDVWLVGYDVGGMRLRWRCRTEIGDGE